MIDPDRLLVVLMAADVPLHAVDAARLCGCQLPRETARRRVRESVAALRARGERIAADTVHGIWLESRAGEFARYLNRRRGRAKGELARAGVLERVSAPMELLEVCDDGQ